MAQYCIFTDAGADLPVADALSNSVEIIQLQYELDGETHISTQGLAFPAAEFYSALEAGKTARAIPPPEDILAAIWEPHLKSGQNILTISMSRYLSDTFSIMMQSRAKLLTVYPQRKIIIADVLCCSAVQGLIVKEAANKRRDGASIDETAKWVIINRLFANGLFIPGDTRFLSDAGLISPVLSFGKPVQMAINKEGLPYVFSRQKNLDAAIDAMCNEIINGGHPLSYIAVAHANNPDAANSVKQRFECDGIKTALLNIGPISGCYLGPGTVGVAFFGAERK